MKIISPVASGNGAYIVHKTLEKNLNNYRVKSYHPYWTLAPFLLPVIASAKADLIHTTLNYGGFFKQRNTPLIVTLHNYVLDPFMRSYSSVLQNIHYQTDLKWSIKRSLTRADILTSVSRFTAQMAKEHLQFDGDIRVIPNGIDTDLFYPKHNKRHSAKIKVLFSGNLSRRKGVQWLADIAMRLNKNIELIFTGGLSASSIVLSGDNLRGIGSIAYEDMNSIYQQVDILLFPTVREGFGLVVTEAMACGLPVVATNCSSIPEILDEGKGGYLCPLGDVDAFAKKINLLAENANLRKQMGDYNRASVEQRFKMETMITAYQSLFEEVLSRS